MQFKNLAIAKKIWCLLLLIMGLTLCAGFGMTYYIERVQDQAQAELQDYDNRIRMAEQWRGITDYAVAHVVMGAMSSEDAITRYAQEKTKAGIAGASAMQKKLEQVLTSAEGQQQLAKIAQARTKVLDVLPLIDQARSNMDMTQSRQLVDAQLVPAVALYNQAQVELVSLQEGMRDRMMQASAQARSNAMLVGSVALGAVVLLGLLLSIYVVRQITAPLDAAVKLADTIASGDLTAELHDDRKDELGSLLRSLHTMTQRLHTVVSEVRGGVESVSSAASQIATGNQDLSSRTEQTAANLEETAASIEELTATVSQSADTARQVNQLAATAVQAAERGGEVVSQVVQSMDQINTSSRKISDIIGVIDGIAFQTNILALNAAVEAARAGEQGRGFAVVAGEVRSLAQRSAEAAKEIKGLITASVSNVDAGSAQVEQAGASMQEIVSSVRRVTDLIGELSAAASEQHDGFAQVNQAVGNLDQMTQQNAALVEESSAAALAMNEQAQRLAQVVSAFKVGHTHTATVLHKPVAGGVATAAAPSALAVGKAKAKAKEVVPAAKAAAQAPLQAPAPQKKGAATVAEAEWENF